MSMVRFATLCDRCGRRSPEYEAWPCCRECFQDVCPLHLVPETFDAESNRAICTDCRTCEKETD